MSARSFAVSISHGNLVYDTVMSAAAGGSIVALFFLIVDSIGGQPFFTPSLVGAVLFQGVPASTVSGVDLGMAAAYTALHFMAFGLLGLAASILAHAAEQRSDPFAVVAVVFIAFEAGFMAFARTLLPGVVEILGPFRIAFANLLAAGAIAFYLVKLRPRVAWSES